MHPAMGILNELRCDGLRVLRKRLSNTICQLAQTKGRDEKLKLQVGWTGSINLTPSALFRALTTTNIPYILVEWSVTDGHCKGAP